MKREFVRCVIGEEQVESEEDRKFLLSMLAVKPLIAAGLFAGSKLPLFFLPKPGIEFTVIKHEGAQVSVPSTQPDPTPPPPTNNPTPTLTPRPTTQTPPLTHR